MHRQVHDASNAHFMAPSTRHVLSLYHCSWRPNMHAQAFVGCCNMLLTPSRRHTKTRSSTHGKAEQHQLHVKTA